MGPDRAIVVTADFITPIVDDPYTWGQIATANAVSDIYAMGGSPLFALNLVSWNSTALPSSALVELLKGAADKAQSGEFLIVGGHTIEDEEPKFGLCVVGEVNPLKILRNDALRPNDSLILTKPLGIGVITTAIKAQEISNEVQTSAIESMLKLNRAAKDVAIRYGASGATDVTGFGLLGHLIKMIMNKALDAHIDVDRIPTIAGAFDLARNGSVPGGSKRNLKWVEPHLKTNGQDDTDLIILADAQTSGGLLFGIEQHLVSDALKDLKAAGVDAANVGCISGGSGQIILENGHIAH